MNNKARLVKKDEIPADFHLRKKGKKQKSKPAPSMTTKAINATQTWLTARKETPSAREAFASLFAGESQSA